LGQLQDIADVVALLAGENARWITGQNLRANVEKSRGLVSLGFELRIALMTVMAWHV
jgi:hypothetical protein